MLFELENGFPTRGNGILSGVSLCAYECDSSRPSLINKSKEGGMYVRIFLANMLDKDCHEKSSWGFVYFLNFDDDDVVVIIKLN